MRSIELLAVRRTSYPHVRVYGSVRSAHLERARAAAPATILLTDWRYDFDPALTGGLDLIRGGLVTTVATLLGSRLTTVEVLEPLQRDGLARTCAAIAAARLSGRMRGREVRIVSYAIENRDNFLPGPEDRLRRRVRRRLDLTMSRLVAGHLDLIAFGTETAAELYAASLGSRLASAGKLVVPALPSPCACLSAAADTRESDLVVFVGAFHERKGLRQLVTSWPRVVADLPAARLVLLGQGALEPLAHELADEVPGVEVMLAPPRDAVHAVLRRAAVLVLLSQRTPAWREQVGLPIVEGLAHGCTVVTTEETGLASWLREHGHVALPAGDDAESTAAALVRALSESRSSTSVLADLPDEDGRLAADAWLMAVSGAVPGQPDEG